MKTTNPDHPIRITLKHLARSLALSAALAFVPATHAAEAIANGGFESPGGNGTAPTNWTADFNSYGTFSGAAHSGSWGLHAGNGANSGGRYQDITTEVGVTYTVSAWAQNFGSAAGSSHLDVLIGTPGTATYNFPNANTAHATTKFASGVTANSFLVGGAWQQYTFAFTATATTTRIGIYNSYKTGDSVHSINVDDVSAAPDSNTTPPAIVTLNPADNATDAFPSANLSAAFNEFIQKGTGNITLKKSADNSVVETFDVATSARVTVSGAALTIDPTDSLAELTGYYVEIDATAVKDMANNAFAGIADNTTWNFTTSAPVTTTTTVVSSGNSSTYGDSVTFTATVSPAPTGGTVQFYNGIDYVGSPVAVNTTTGVATVSTTTLGVGTGEITADYSGYQIYEASTTAASISQVVNKAPLTVTAFNSIRPTNSANPTFTHQITGFKNSQTLGTSGVTGTPSLTTTADLSSPAGAYPITCALGTLAASNYSFTLVNGTLTIVATDTPEIVTLIESIALASPNSWGGIAVTNPSSNIAVTGAGPLTLGAGGINMADSTVNLTLGTPITLGASQTWTAASGRTLEASGIISGSSMGLTKAGFGTLTLKGANTYDGTTTISGGALVADTASTATILNSASPLDFTGTGTFQLKGLGGQTRSQILNGLTLTRGAATIDANNTGTSTTIDLRGVGGTLTIARSTGATVDFKATTGTFATNAIVKTAQANDSTGILGAWATVNTGADWAINNGSDVAAAYTGYNTLTGNTLATAGTANYRVTNGTTGNITMGATGTIDINTLRLNDATARTIDARNTTTQGILRFGAVGGLLTSGNNGHTIGVSGATTRGTITAGGADNTPGELVVHNTSNLTINSVIANNGSGAVSLTKSGTSTLTLNTTNTYTGGTVINGGTVSQATQVNGVFGTGPVTLNNGAVLGFSINTLTNSVVINNGTFNGGNSFGDNTTGPITLNGQLTVATEGTGNRTLSGIISGAGSILKTGSGSGSVYLFGNNTYSGGTYHQGGLVRLGHINALGTGTLWMNGDSQGLHAEANLNVGTGVTNNIVLQKDCAIQLWGGWPVVNYDMLLSGTISGSGGITVNGTAKTLFLSGTNTYTGATTISSGRLTIDDGSIASSSSIVNNAALEYKLNTNAGTYANVISGTGTLTKTGTNTLTLSGANTYTGVTTVSAGTLAVTGTLGATAVSVNAGTLAGSGNIGGNVTIASGASHALAVAATADAQVTRAITGTLTLTAGNILDLTAAATPANGEYVLATATTAITGSPTTINYNGITGGTISVDNASSPKRLLLTVAGSPYDTWAADFLPADVSNPAGNNDGDSLTNLQEFAFGTNPTDSTGEIVYSGETLTTPGAPKLVVGDDGTYSMVFGRRADSVAAGLTYTVQFSADLITWVDNNDGTNAPVQVATDSTIDVMSVTYPATIVTQSGTPNPKFSRVKVVLATP